MGDGGSVAALKSAILAGEGLDGPRLLAILDHIEHPIFVKDRKLRWVLLNEAFEKLMGFPREEMLGKTDADYFPADQAAFFRAKDLEMFRTGNTVVIEQEPVTDAKGEVHALATTKTPLRDASGEVTHLVGIIHDITRLVRAEDALRLANDELERRVAERTSSLEAAQQDLVRKERLAVLGRLAGGLAHQLRNPLGAIRNATSLLERYADDPSHPSYREAIRVLQDESAHANRVVTDLVSYARVRTPHGSRVPLAETLRELAASLGLPTRNVSVDEGRSSPTLASMEATGVRVKLASAPSAVVVELCLADVPDAFIDELQTHEAVRNLLRNGVEAMPHGGTLRVVLDRAEPGFVRICVQDEGEGIPMAIRQRMFEPLLTTKPTGLGLGLVTAQALIASQGGRLEWSSVEGQGTRFEVILPQAQEAIVGLPARSA